MGSNILSVTTQILSYKDSTGVTDNPQQRNVDWTRRIDTIMSCAATSDEKTIAPGDSLVIFSGYKPTALNGSSVVALQAVSPQNSVYRLSVTAGPSAFRTARTPSGIANCVVTVNNNAVAVFNFTAATLNDVAVGDIMRIKGAVMYDTGPYAFNPLNAGIWKIIGISGTQVSCVRLPGQSFSGVVESPTGVAADVQFYSSTGIQDGDKMTITGVFSVVSQKTFVARNVTPTTVDFVSAQPLPNETGLTYVTGAITFYSSAKRQVYVEADQDAVVQFNADTSNNNKLSPIVCANGSASQVIPGFIHKWGDTYSCTVVNMSINPLNIKFILGE
ncbi:MAG: hypothetical protein ACREGB_00790 [Candidatus Saccharimonadales bacterium]